MSLEPTYSMTIRDVAIFFNCSKRHIERLTKLGKFPKPLRLGGINRWSRGVIEAWAKNAGTP